MLVYIFADIFANWDNVCYAIIYLLERIINMANLALFQCYDHINLFGSRPIAHV